MNLYIKGQQTAWELLGRVWAVLQNFAGWQGRVWAVLQNFAGWQKALKLYKRVSAGAGKRHGSCREGFGQFWKLCGLAKGRLEPQKKQQTAWAVLMSFAGRQTASLKLHNRVNAGAGKRHGSCTFPRKRQREQKRKKNHNKSHGAVELKGQCRGWQTAWELQGSVGTVLGSLGKRQA